MPLNKENRGFKIKEKVKLLFKPKINIYFSSSELIKNELEILEKVGVMEKVDYSDKASPTEHVKKKFKRRVWADFSTGLNDCFEACSGLRSGAWPWKRNNGKLGAFN